MSVNLLVHAPTQGTLFCLDDQPATADNEKQAAEALKLNWRPTERPRKFIDRVLEWKQWWQHDLTDEQRPETKAALVIDNRMTRPVDIEEFIEEKLELEEAKASIPKNKELLDVDRGSRTGLIFIQYIIRAVSDLRDLPVMLLSAYTINKYEDTLKKLNKQYAAPTTYVPKVASKINGADIGLFSRIVGNWMFDRGLYIMHRLAYDLWDLSEDEVCGALALRSGNIKEIGDLFDRRRPRLTLNTDQRVDCLRIIHERLSGLFNCNRDVELEWLSTPVWELGNSRPLDLICTGDFQKLSLVHGYVEGLAEPWTGHNMGAAHAGGEQ